MQCSSFILSKIYKPPTSHNFFSSLLKTPWLGQQQKKINRNETPDNPNPSTAVGVISASVPTYSHHSCRSAKDNDTSLNKDNICGNAKSSKSLKLPKSSTARPCKPYSVGTSLRIATQRSLQESSFKMLKIPKKKNKAGGGGGSTNLNLGDEECVDGGVGRSRKVAAARGRPKG